MINTQALTSADHRVNSLDVGRGLAIVAVMYGHSLELWWVASAQNFSEPAFLQWKFGASFIMAFFFFASGARWREGRSLDDTIRQALALIIITWIASVILDGMQLFITRSGQAAALGEAPMDVLRLVKNAVRMAVVGDRYSMGALWFLPALAWVRVIAASSIRFGKATPYGVAAMLIGLLILWPALGWRNYFQLHLLGAAFAAFMLGHAMRGAVRRVEVRPAVALILMTVGLVVTWMTFDLNQGCRWDVRGSCPLSHERFGVSFFSGHFGNLPLFLLSAITGSACALGMSSLLARFGARLGERLAVWGRASLSLLIINAFIMHLINPALSVWVAPFVRADRPLFFVALFLLTLALNLLAATLFSRPLRMLHRLSSSTAGGLVEAARAVQRRARPWHYQRLNYENRPSHGRATTVAKGHKNRQHCA